MKAYRPPLSKTPMLCSVVSLNALPTILLARLRWTDLMVATADPLDLNALEKSLNEASSKLNGLWISFCLFLTYSVVAVGSVTHRQLFLNSPLEMPALAIKLPLVGFFIPLFMARILRRLT